MIVPAIMQRTTTPRTTFVHLILLTYQDLGQNHCYVLPLYSDRAQGMALRVPADRILSPDQKPGDTIHARYVRGRSHVAPGNRLDTFSPAQACPSLRPRRGKVQTYDS